MVDELHVGEGLVERRDVEVVVGVGDRCPHEGVDLVADSRAVVLRREHFPRHRRALRMRDEELVVVGPTDLLRDDRQHVGEEVERLGAREERGDRLVVEEVGERRERGLQPVGQLRAVGHAAARADVEHWLEPAGGVDEAPVVALRERAAAALGDEGDEVGERLAEPERRARRRRA